MDRLSWQLEGHTGNSRRRRMVQEINTVQWNTGICVPCLLGKEYKKAISGLSLRDSFARWRGKWCCRQTPEKAVNSERGISRIAAWLEHTLLWWLQMLLDMGWGLAVMLACGGPILCPHPVSFLYQEHLSYGRRNRSHSHPNKTDNSSWV